MFTLGACFFVALLAWLAHRSNEKHRREYRVPDDRHEWLLLLHVREDLKLVAFLLGGIMILLGIIADQVHPVIRF
jgi:hypothetical protein